MKNVTTSSQIDASVAAALEATQEIALDTTGPVTAVLDAPAPAPEATPAVDAAIEQAPAAPEAQDQPLVYSHQDLLNARTLVLKYKQSGKFHGYGMKVGPMIRNTIGYKFDAMDVQEVLKAMDTPDFLEKYQKTTDGWFAGVKHDDSLTGKSNTARHQEASALSKDATAFKALVKALRILCVRNQDWHEKGSHLALSMNGHRALLDFFGIQVTNNRRLKLTAS